MTKVRLNDLNLNAREDYEDEMDGALSERGPWSITISDSLEGDRVRVALQSDDFTHDVALVITGDFRSIRQKVKYAELLADRMNRMPS